MPGRDGNGPMGSGWNSRRAAGVCRQANAFGYGARGGRMGMGRGMGNCLVLNSAPSENLKSMLIQEQQQLQKRLEFIVYQLERM